MEVYNKQNTKLKELYIFLKTTLNDNKSDAYIDTIINENRAAIFAKILLLLENVPIK